MKPFLPILALALPVLAGCRLEPPCGCGGEGGGAASGKQHVVFDWSLDPEASPAGMRLWLYPQDWKGEAFPLDLPGRDGGEVRLDPGNYLLIAFNNDSEWTYTADREDFFALSLQTRDATLLEPLEGGASFRNEAGTRSGVLPEGAERVAACPDAVWTASASVNFSDSSTVTLQPTPMHCHYTFRFEMNGSLQHVAKASASISGMSAACLPSTLGHRGDLCTLPLAASFSPDGNDIHGDFLTFGVPPDSQSRNRMALYLVMDNGKAYKFTEGENLDVTQQIHSASNPREVQLIIRGLTVPNPATGDEHAFEIGVDDWDSDVNINLPL